MSASRSETEARLIAWINLPPPAVGWVAQYIHSLALDSTPAKVMEADLVRIGPWFLPVPPLVLLVRCLRAYALALGPAGALLVGIADDLQALLPSPIPAKENIPAVDASLPAEPATEAAPTTAPGDANAEGCDIEGGTIEAGAASGTEDAAALPAEGGPPPLSPKPAWARAWARRAWRRRARRGPLHSLSINTAGGSVEQDDQGAAADCAAPEDKHYDGEGKHGVGDGPVHDAAKDDLDNGGDDDGRDDERGGDDGRDHGDDDGGHESYAEEPVDVPVDFPDDGIEVDPEIAALLPPESTEERLTLQQNLLAEGCRHPLVVWRDGPRLVLLDGHTRRVICRARHIFYKAEFKEFPDRVSAIAWVIENQLGRRNITAEAQAYLRGKLYNAHKRQGARTDLTSGPADQRLTLAQRMGEEYGVGEKTIRREADFAEVLDQLAATYGKALKDAVLTRDAKMTRKDVRRAAKLDTTTRDYILARIGQREAAVDVILEVLRERAAQDRRAPAAGAENAGQVDVVTPSEAHDQPENRPNNAPTRSGPDHTPNADYVDRHTIDGAVDALEARVQELKQGELRPVHAQRLVERLSEIQRDLVARATTAKSEAPGAPPSVPQEAPSFRQNTSTPGHRLMARPSPGLVRLPAIDHLHQAVEQTGGPLPRDGGARSSPRPPEP